MSKVNVVVKLDWMGRFYWQATLAGADSMEENVGFGREDDEQSAHAAVAHSLYLFMARKEHHFS